MVYHALERRHKQDLDIKQHRPVFDIIEIVVHTGADGCISAQTVDLRPAGKPGTRVVLNY